MNKPKTNSKEFFQYLLQFGLFYISAITLALLWFELIDTSFQNSPDDIKYSWVYTLMTLDVSILIVMTPAFLLLSWYSKAYLRKHPERKDIGFRRWMMYLTVFLTALSFIWFLIFLINDFILGDLTAAFVIKTVILLIVAACVFAYYFWEVEADPSSRSMISCLAGWIYLAITVLCIVFYFLVVNNVI